VLLNPSCSTIVCALPTYRNLEMAKDILAEVQKSNLSDSVKSQLKEVMNEWSYDERQEVCTEAYPDGTLESFVWHADELKKHIPNIADFPEPRYVDNLGGGGHWEVVEIAWMIAKLQVFGKITEDEAKKMDDCMGDMPSLLTDCNNCLNKMPDINCKEYVKRIVGECEGKFEKSLKEKLQELINEVENEQEAANYVKSKL
jgi:hypothetical protein